MPRQLVQISLWISYPRNLPVSACLYHIYNTDKFPEAQSQIDDTLSRNASPTGSCISEARSELLNIVTGFGSKSKRASRLDREDEERSRSRAASRAASRAGSRAASVERIKKLEPRKQDPIMRRLEDIDPFEILHSTPDQLAKQLGVHKGKGAVGDINHAIEDIRTKSRVSQLEALFLVKIIF